MNSKLNVEIPTRVEIPTFTPKHNTEAIQTPNTPLHLDNLSLANHEEGSSPELKSDSIPSRLKKFYSHRSFRQIVLSILSMMSITFAFVALFVGRIDECATLGFVVSIITLFAPSPLS